jgi:hypothetical protein
MHDQKITNPPERGDCLIACILSVLGLPYDARGDAFRERMDQIVDANGDWIAALDCFAIGMGKRFRFDTMPSAVPPGILTIAGGASPRGCAAGHAVLVRGGGSEVVHDPHPSKAGIVGDAVSWFWFEDIAA